jgi:hypothetical protein
MKKNLTVAVLAALGVAALGGCSTTGTTPAAQSTPLEKEIVSAALLASPSAKTSYLAARSKAAQAPLSFDPNDVSSSLASFDALDLESYGIETNEKVSDKEAYAHEEEIIYSQPDGTKKTIVLYYGSGTIAAASSASAADKGTIDISGTATVESDDDEAEIKAGLHGHGWRSGGFNGMLEADMEIDDYEDEANATISGEWKQGIAYVEEVEYSFYSEKLAITVTEEDGDKETADFASFGLFRAGSFVTVEQLAITEGTEKETAYAYTAFTQGGFERFLLTQEEDDVRLVYLTPMEKLVLHRFEKDGKTLYAFYVNLSGQMHFAGIYEKVVTTNDDGTQSVTYQLYSNDKSQAPDED